MAENEMNKQDIEKPEGQQDQKIDQGGIDKDMENKQDNVEKLPQKDDLEIDDDLPEQEAV